MSILKASKAERKKKMQFISGKINLPLDNYYVAVFSLTSIIQGELKLIRARVVIGKQDRDNAHTHSLTHIKCIDTD